jgi:hypothetical protein
MQLTLTAKEGIKMNYKNWTSNARTRLVRHYMATGEVALLADRWQVTENACAAQLLRIRSGTIADYVPPIDVQAFIAANPVRRYKTGDTAPTQQAELPLAPMSENSTKGLWAIVGGALALTVGIIGGVLL